MPSFPMCSVNVPRGMRLTQLTPASTTSTTANRFLVTLMSRLQNGHQCVVGPSCRRFSGVLELLQRDEGVQPAREWAGDGAPGVHGRELDPVRMALDQAGSVQPWRRISRWSRPRPCS
jgi:hypothetical protein